MWPWNPWKTIKTRSRKTMKRIKNRPSKLRIKRYPPPVTSLARYDLSSLAEKSQVKEAPKAKSSSTKEAPKKKVPAIAVIKGSLRCSAIQPTAANGSVCSFCASLCLASPASVSAVQAAPSTPNASIAAGAAKRSRNQAIPLDGAAETNSDLNRY